jgi:hypothetical protein
VNPRIHPVRRPPAVTHHQPQRARKYYQPQNLSCDSVFLLLSFVLLIIIAGRIIIWRSRRNPE